MKNYQYLKEYLPVRYQANAQQLADRQTCYNFKDGYLNDEVKSGFLNKIQEITNGEKTGWSICFIPASTKSKSQARYKKLAEAIQAAGYKVAINAIYNEHDHEAGHLTGKPATQSKASASTPVTSQAKSSSSLTTSSQEEEPSKWLQKSWKPWGQQA